jgi:predicted lipoprotein with Yx(FWY)xxD motif
MRNRRTTLVTTAVVGVAAATAVGAVALGAGSSVGYATGSTPSSAAGTGRGTGSGPAVLHATTTAVQGTAERILVDAEGDPLYTYRPDTATTSRVSGQLAVLWPPLVARTASVRGATGRLTTVSTAHGSQVAYNGHLLYTFVQDRPGQVTGQGVQDFFVATPGLRPLASTGAGTSAAPTGGGY